MILILPRIDGVSKIGAGDPPFESVVITTIGKLLSVNVCEIPLDAKNIIPIRIKFFSNNIFFIINYLIQI